MSMSHFRLLLAVCCLTLSGCGEDPARPVDPAAKKDLSHAEIPAAETVPSSSRKPTAELAAPKSNVEFTILEGGPKAPGQSESVGDHRSQRILVSGAKTQEEFEGAVRQSFEALAEEIEKTDKASKSKRVEVIAYDNPIDAEARDVFTLHAFSAVGAAKPRWEQAQLDWRWRLPGFRPSEKWLRIHADYRKLRATVEKLSDAQKEVCSQYELTVDEFIDLHAYMMMWHSGLEPNGELLEEWKADLRKKNASD
jgi:hypothetical protein